MNEIRLLIEKQFQSQFPSFHDGNWSLLPTQDLFSYLHEFIVWVSTIPRLGVMYILDNPQGHQIQRILQHPLL